MRRKRSRDPRLALLLDAIDRAYDGKGWHGPTLRGALRGMTPATALFRAAPGAHGAWELLLHAAYWKYVVRRRIEGGPRGAFARRPANFPAIPKPADARSLAADLRLLDAEHARLRATVAALPPARLDEKRGAWTIARLVQGAAAHDIYHAGQIGLLKRLRAAGVKGAS